MKSTKVPVIAFITIVCLALPFRAETQEEDTAIPVAQCPLFPVPALNRTTGERDGRAEQEINAFLHSRSGAAWRDLQASGDLEYPTGDSHSATLYLLGTDFSRLDVVMDSGTRSLRSHGARGSFQNENGDQEGLMPVTSRTGVVALPLLWSDPLRSPHLSIRDAGLVQIGGEELHRITLEYPLNAGLHKSGNPTAVADLYFDPITHDLLYSVDMQSFANSGGQLFQRVTKYAAYQSFDGFVMPSSIQQFLGGQALWTLRVTRATVNSNLPASTFSF